MTRASIGAWIDERCPPLGELLKPHGIAARDFEAWLGELLGRYRFAMTTREALPPRAGELRMLEDLDGALHSLAATLRAGLGPRGKAEAGAVAARIDVAWPNLIAAMRRDVAIAQGVLREARSRLTATPSKRGRRAELARADLLAAIVERLRAEGLTVRKARDLAADICERVGVPAPKGDVDNRERAVRRAAKKRGQK